MTWNLTTISDLKHKVRKLKQAETTIRFGGKPNSKPLVWHSFFDLNDVPRDDSKYSLSKLAAMSRDEYKAVVDEFFSRVYYEFYMENGIIYIGVYDPAVLARLGLPPHADESGVKARFRELAKKYHPDSGGDAAKFVELMKTYKELIRKINCTGRMKQGCRKR